MTYDDQNQRRHKRIGQTLVEFAITLPVLLLLLFGTIEFGRAFQAWVTLENAAREAARYTTTGQYDRDKYDLFGLFPCTVEDFDNGPGQRVGYTFNSAVTVHTQGGQITPQSLFATYYDGRNCDPGSAEHLELRRDILRLSSIYDVARRSAAGLALEPGVQDGTLTPLFNQLAHRWQAQKPRSDQAGYFDVLVCSTRAQLDTQSSVMDGRSPSRFHMVFDSSDIPNNYTHTFEPPFCMLNEVPPEAIGDAEPRVDNAGMPWIDAGGPGDRISVIVTFNHPLITPLFDFSHFTMQARRSGVNETFRTSRALNAVQGGAPQAALIPDPPSDFTPPDDDPGDGTPDGTDEPEPTEETSTEVPPPTLPDPFDCEQLNISDIIFTQNAVEFRIANTGFHSATLRSVNLAWRRPSDKPNMMLRTSALNSEVHWTGFQETSPILMSDPGNFNTDELRLWRRAGRQVPGSQITGQSESVSLYRATFINVGASLAYNAATNPNGLTPGDFSDTQLTFSSPTSPVTCTITISEVIPPPDETTGTATPIPTPIDDDFEPDCAADVTVSFSTFQRFGIVRLRVDNYRNVPSPLMGFDLFWFDHDPEPLVSEYDIPSQAPGVTSIGQLQLEEVIAGPIGGSGAFDSASAVPVWRGPDDTSRTTYIPGQGGEGTWLRNYEVPAMSSAYIYLNFSGTSLRLDEAFDMEAWMFSGEFWFECLLPNGEGYYGNGLIPNGRTPFGEPPPPPTPPPDPGIIVRHGNNNIANGGSTTLPQTVVGIGVTRTLGVISNGGAPLQLTGNPRVAVEGSGVSITRQPSNVINPGARSDFDVRCDADRSEDYSADILIPNNTSDNNPYRITVNCRVKEPAPDLEVRRSNGSTVIPHNTGSFNFGTRNVGSSARHDFRIYSIGDGPVDINNITIDGAGFSIRDNDHQAGVVQEGDWKRLRIRCDATTVGEYTATVSIPNNSVNSSKNPYTFTVSCNVIPQPTPVVPTPDPTPDPDPDPEPDPEYCDQFPDDPACVGGEQGGSG
ncbi:MAG: pilus assembly protein [Anaerolineaceae bacterium]|nr:MAG: pilus assembly protein [Anaerolineaceae bacterium]